MFIEAFVGQSVTIVTHSIGRVFYMIIVYVALGH